MGAVSYTHLHAFVQGFLQGHGLHGNKGEVELVSGNYCIRMIDRFSFSVHPVSYTHLDVYKRQIEGNRLYTGYSGRSHYNPCSWIGFAFIRVE